MPTASLFLRLSLAFAFFYAAISGFIIPDAWIGFIPQFVFDILPISPNIFLAIHSIAEIILGLWLLSGKWTFNAALISAAALFFITVFNFGAMIVVFRDVSLTLAALALAALTKPTKPQKS